MENRFTFMVPEKRGNDVIFRRRNKKMGFGLMRLPKQMEDNLSFMKNFKSLSDDERKTLTAAQEVLSRIPLIPCTSCVYCAKVCPQHIAIMKELEKVSEALA